jgi:hypothetical protein
VDSGGSRDTTRRLPVARSDRWATTWSVAAARRERWAVSRRHAAVRRERWGTTVSRSSQLPDASGGALQSPGGSQLPGASGGQPGSSDEVVGSTVVVETPQATGDADVPSRPDARRSPRSEAAQEALVMLD